jgi:uncharacterized membrane protein YeaQ/YmgE (transglycosylase-associated protein family)
MSWIVTIVVGLIVGFIARALHPGKDSIGLIMTALLGIGGALLANFVGGAIGWYKQGDAAGWIASVVGAVLLLVIYGLVKRKTAGST